MPIPVPIPDGPLTISDSDSDKAESLVSLIVQIIKSGTTGATLNTPPTLIPDGENPTAQVPQELASEKEQAFLRQVSVALARSFLTLSETSSVPGPNLVPRAGVDGTLDPGWLSGGGSSAGAATFEARCQSTDAVGDLVRVWSPYPDVAKTSITSYGTLPAVGCIVAKPSTVSCVVQVSGLVSGVYSGLTPGKIYFVGSDSRPTATAPVPGSTEILFHQSIGVAIMPDLFFILPSFNLTRVRGSDV